MAAGYNRIILVGNLTRDPEHKQLASGQSTCRLGLAVNRQYPSRQTGAMVQEVCFIDIDVWGAQAESCRQYLSKGRPVLVEGRLKFDSWDDQQTGQKRSKHSIVAERVVFLSSGAGADVEVGSSEKGESVDPDTMPREPQNDMERGLMDQIEQIKNRAKAAAQPRVVPAPKQEAAVSVGEVNFTDQPPFQDDLPF